MITNKDLEIENISYTNKDFGQIYPELLELVNKLTNRWDPQNTNESDPGIVLLKLIAFLGDKLNYNIDKNTLEQFIVSATQETSMRRLTEMLGYNMKYYRSATTKISFRYLGELGVESSDESSSDSLSKYTDLYIKAFDTTFKTDDDKVYTLLEDIYINNGNKLATGKLAIEGSMKVLSVLNSDNYTNSTLIQLYNLDSDNRLYFPDVEVAENGIFINDEVYDSIYNDDAWHRVDNLNDQELRTKVFKFGFDSEKGYPYIEFPKDISDIIGEGLKVSYIVSSGELGKVLNNKLTKIDKIKITDKEGTEIQTSLDDSLYLLSNSSSTDAYNPETLTEAYDNFKKTIGTFDTLVSCKDYSNYINRFLDNESNKLVSNVQITDVRTDPYYSKLTLIRDKTASSYYSNEVTEKYKAQNDAYKIIAHGTATFNQTVDTKNQYEKTYTDLTTTDIKNISIYLDDVKTINHNLATPENESLNFIEADYTLKVNVSTKYKVNSSEQKEIINNIKASLYSNFNSSKLDFGQEIPFETLLSVISNSDTRIKNVSLDDPDITYYIKNQGLDKVAFNPTKEIDDHLDIIVDNIRAGSLPFYAEDNSFAYDYDMDLKNLDKYNNLCAIKGYIEVVANRKLKENESIQLLEDSYITKISYPAYVYYAFIKSDSTTPGEVIVQKDQVYKLKQNEFLYIQYTDSSDILQFITYRENDIIKPNFDIVNTKGLAKITTTNVNITNKTASKFVNWSEKTIDTETTANTYLSSSNLTPLFSIGTNEQIDILKRNEVILDSGSSAFWYIKPKVGDYKDNKNPVTNEEGNLLFNSYRYTKDGATIYGYVLEEGELFIYPNSDMTSLNILTSGTKLEYSVEKINRVSSEIIDLDELEKSIEDEDIGTFKKSFSWQSIPNELTIVESVISTYIEGDIINSFKLNGDENEDENTKIDNTWRKIYSLKVNDSLVTLSSEANPLIRSILSLSNKQKILEDQNVSIYKSHIEKEKSSTETSSNAELAKISKQQIQVNNYIQIYPEIDSYNNMCVLQSIRYSEKDSKYEPIKENNQYLHDFTTYRAISYTLINYSQNATEKTLSDLVLYVRDSKKTVSENDRDEYLINSEDIKTFLGDNKKIKMYSNVDDMYFNIFDTVTGNTKLYQCTEEDNNNNNYFELDLNEFLDSTGNNILYVTKPKILKTVNYIETLGKDKITKIKEELDKISNFDYIGPRNSSKLINSYNPLYSFFDPNNVYNRLTLAKINFDLSEFNVVGSSKI